MDSDFHQQQYQHNFQEYPMQFHNQKQQANTLTRFRSAPSSYFSSILDTINTTGGGNGGDRRDFSNARPLSPETENIFDNFMSSIGAESSISSQTLSKIPENAAAQPDCTVTVKQEKDLQQQQGNFKNQSQRIYHSQSKPPLGNQHSFTASSREMGGLTQMKTVIGEGRFYNKNSSLTRHSSSPAGFFDNLNIDTGSGGVGNYGSNLQINYSTGQPSSTSGLTNQNFQNSNYGFPMTSWDDSILSEKFSRGDDRNTLSELASSDKKSGDKTMHQPGLTHHLSLPKTLPDMSHIENFLQFQNTVPHSIRAKRGCATHPRSIAERVRRTKISERMRKLQDLVPNMDKQTNTSDMLDLAVDYIKDLQKQVETLTHNRAHCTCSR